jgi:hypothetical protein
VLDDFVIFVQRSCSVHNVMVGLRP